jgi:hypothetical protein
VTHWSVGPSMDLGDAAKGRSLVLVCAYDS